MKQTITQFTFAQAFKNMGRQDQFTLGALNALFEYIEEYEDDSGEQIELDPIAICGEWSEFSDFEEAKESYGYLVDGCIAPGFKFEQLVECLQENTQVIEFNGGILVASF